MYSPLSLFIFSKQLGKIFLKPSDKIDYIFFLVFFHLHEVFTQGDIIFNHFTVLTKHKIILT